ncbi:MAG: hypothetical protein CL910_21950 [Deltaproteobacteria bacterium]|jgi:hypothetical protein|nr:hypothetical protein [Deltaproteobacteria bacterium]
MKRSTIHRRRAGNVLPILLLLVLAMAGGGWNYWRNLKKEPPRPYAQYPDAELGQLISAYEGDVEQRGTSLPPARMQGQRRSGAMLDERVADFEAARRHGDAHRAASGALAGQEAVLRELRKEQARRAEGPLAVHLKRLTTI